MEATMRRVLLFVLGAGMICGGVYFLYLQIFYSQRIYLVYMGGAAGGIVIGFYILWEDVIRAFWRGESSNAPRP
jgi:hypothetical protein